MSELFVWSVVVVSSIVMIASAYFEIKRINKLDKRLKDLEAMVQMHDDFNTALFEAQHDININIMKCLEGG
jgi:hypothetical protein